MLIEALALDRSRVIALCGAGGKTTLMLTLADECVQRGERVLITTTTRIGSREVAGRWPMFEAIRADDVSRAAGSALPRDTSGAIVVYTAKSADGEKLIGLDPHLVDALSESRPFDRILVEADGAARRPLKAPDAHEPVIPASTDVVILVCGLSGVGWPLSDERVFRPERWSALTGIAAGAIVTPPSVADVIVHPDGVARGAPSHARRLLFLNQADTPERKAIGREIADRLRQRRDQMLPGSRAPVYPERVAIGTLLPAPAVIELVLSRAR